MARIGKCNSCKKEIVSEMFKDWCDGCGKIIHRCYPNIDIRLPRPNDYKHLNKTFLDCQTCDKEGSILCTSCYSEYIEGEK